MKLKRLQKFGVTSRIVCPLYCFLCGAHTMHEQMIIVSRNPILFDSTEDKLCLTCLTHRQVYRMKTVMETRYMSWKYDKKRRLMLYHKEKQDSGLLQETANAIQKIQQYGYTFTFDIPSQEYHVLTSDGEIEHRCDGWEEIIEFAETLKENESP